ncbi:MAG: transglutaminase family protein [bacterium]|nr:transglutaminase family protein [bacterium]
MYYSIRHTTEFLYSVPITESMMEVRMQPRTEPRQRCLSFQLDVTPRTLVSTFRDALGNLVHHFDIQQSHRRLLLVAESLVETSPAQPLPAALPASGWDAYPDLIDSAEAWESLTPSHFAQPTPLLYQLAEELNAVRRDDPLTLLHQINTGMWLSFTYKPNSTSVDSPIDDALSNRAGVCQDYAHIMIALAREVGIPCRYVSGYLFHRDEDTARTADDASHAWVEALLPDLGWVGFDPTNNVLAGERHIRVAVGRDYADVPPTKGVFKGSADTTLKVSVQVYPTDRLPTYEGPMPEELVEPSPANIEQEQMQQQQ